MDVQTTERVALAIKYLEKKLSILGEARILLREKNGNYTYYIKWAGEERLYRYNSLAAVFRATGLDIKKFNEIFKPAHVVQRSYNSLMLKAMMMKLKLNPTQLAYLLGISTATAHNYINLNPRLELPRRISMLLDLLDRYENIRRQSQQLPLQRAP